jgi:hypothetical protein
MVKCILVYGTNSDTFKLCMDIMDTTIQKDINSHQVVKAVLTTFINHLHKYLLITLVLLCHHSWLWKDMTVS